jgi:hypothetical protein
MTYNKVARQGTGRRQKGRIVAGEMLETVCPSTRIKAQMATGKNKSLPEKRTKRKMMTNYKLL